MNIRTIRNSCYPHSGMKYSVWRDNTCIGETNDREMAMRLESAERMRRALNGEAVYLRSRGEQAQAAAIDEILRVCNDENLESLYDAFMNVGR